MAGEGYLSWKEVAERGDWEAAAEWGREDPLPNKVRALSISDGDAPDPDASSFFCFRARCFRALVLTKLMRYLSMAAGVM